MLETVGSLNLKIARLENRLKLLEQQRLMSRPYPAHQMSLDVEYSRIQFEIHQLTRQRQERLQTALAA